MAYVASTYVLLHHGTYLLSLSAEATTPALAIGHEVEPYNVETGESLGWFVVERISRRLPYRNLGVDGQRALSHGEEIQVHVRKL